jgi:hypothetical protein
LLGLLLALVGCFADLDWRELRSEEGGFSVWLPAKPVEQSRELSGRPGVVMRQWSARARETAFAAGYASLPGIDRATLTGMSDALVGNISGKVEKRHDIALGEARGIETIASGEGGGSALALRVRVYAYGGRLYQVAVLGKPGDVAEADLETFFSSFRIDTKPAVTPPEPARARRQALSGPPRSRLARTTGARPQLQRRATATRPV